MKIFENEYSDNPKTGNVDISQYVEAHIKNTFSSILLPQLQNSALGTFNNIQNLQNQLTTSPMELVLGTGKLKLVFGLDKDGVVIKSADLYGRSFYVRHVKQNRTYSEKDDGQTIVYYPQSNPEQFESNYQALIYRYFISFIHDLSSEIVDIHYLPASRSGLYQALSAFGQIVAELAKNRTMLTRKIELPGISEPLSDYFLKLSEARQSKANDMNIGFFKVAERIENEILHGTVDFDEKTKRITYKPENTRLALDLSATSSMVSEISPIVSYMKLVLSKQTSHRRRRYTKDGINRQMIIIEEPEAHLHPEVQTKLMSVFAQLVKETGTKLVMTSHSNYIFNKTSNLIIEKKIDDKSFRAVFFKRTKKGSLAEDLKVSEFGIQDENFIDTGEAIYQERLDLFDKINEAAK